MAIVYFIRHGETPFNVDKKMTGRGSNPHLTENGIAQVNQMGQLLDEQYNGQISFMVSSNMTRTNQTAFIINQHLNIDIKFNNDLQDKDHGLLEGLLIEEVLPIVKALDYHEAHPVYGGESDKAFKSRVIDALCSYLQSSEPAILVVSHSYAGFMATKTFLGEGKHLSNGELVILDPESILNFSGECGIEV